jgi:subtilisin-like proprotein convertase family protein
MTKRFRTLNHQLNEMPRMTTSTPTSLKRHLQHLVAALGFALAGAAHAAVTTASYVGPPVAIPANVPAGVNVVLPVAGAPIGITALTFRFDALAGCDTTAGNVNAAVDHTFLDDLIFRLTSPAGTTVQFVNRRGGNGNNICTTSILNDGISPSASTWPFAGAISGTWQPESPFTVFNGQNPNGNWTLNVSDTFVADTGSVRRFSLLISSGVDTPQSVPTLSEFGMMGLTLLVMGFGLGVIRRRRGKF